MSLYNLILLYKKYRKERVYAKKNGENGGYKFQDFIKIQENPKLTITFLNNKSKNIEILKNLENCN